MAIYVLLVIWLLFLSFFQKKIKKKQKKLFFFFTCLFIILIVGFRNISVGNDSAEYKRIFLDISSYSFAELLTDTGRYEKGFTLYCKFISLFSTNYHVLFIVSALISMIPIFVLIRKYSKDYFLSLLCYIFFRFMFMNMNALRQSIAIGIIVIALMLLIKKKVIASIIVTIIASLFHTSAIVFLLLIIIRNVVPSKKIFIFWIVATGLVFVFINQLLELVYMVLPQFAHYKTSIYFNSAGLGNVLVVFICSLFVVLTMITLHDSSMLKKRKFTATISNFVVGRKYKIANVFNLSLLLAFTFYVISLNASLIDRVALYFFIPIVVMVPQIIVRFRKKDRLIVKISLSTVMATYFFVTLILRPEWNLVVPYVFGG